MSSTKDDPNPSPDIRLRRLANLFESRNAEYGNAYIKFGAVLKALLPDGIDLVTESDFARLGCFVLLAGKLHRYGLNFSKGGHDDSLDDIAVYAAMLRDLDWQTKT